MDQVSKGITKLSSQDSHSASSKGLFQPHIEEHLPPGGPNLNEDAFEEFENRNFSKDSGFQSMNHTYSATNPKIQEILQKNPVFNSSNSSKSNNNPSSGSGRIKSSKEAHYYHTEEEVDKKPSAHPSHRDEFVAFDTKEKIFQFQEEGNFCYGNDTYQNLDNLEENEEYKTHNIHKTYELQIKQEQHPTTKNVIKCEYITQKSIMHEDNKEDEETPRRVAQSQKRPEDSTASAQPNIMQNTYSLFAPQENYYQRLQYFPQPTAFRYFSQPMHTNISLGMRDFLIRQLMDQHSYNPFNQNQLVQQQKNLQNQTHFNSDVMSIKQKIEAASSKGKSANESSDKAENSLLNNLSSFSEGKFVPLKDCGLGLLEITKKYSKDLPKKRPGKNPYELPKDVGRHFLKVHMKKAIVFILQNTEKVTEAMKTYFFKNNNNRWKLSEAQQEEFISSKVTAFMAWIEHLKKIFKDYGKEDFKTAFCVDSNTIRQKISNTQSRDRASLKELFEYKDWDTQVTFKEVFKLCTLDFIRNIEENGLIYELMNANNILTGVDHIRYVYLSEWLVELPSRIDSAEIFGKRWVETFFRTNNLIMNEPKVE